MIDFFDKTYEHRPSYPIYATYPQYKPLLKEDFGERCAYCCDLDKYRISNFAIDHYVPRNPDGCVSHLADNHYENLIYACSYCNRAKWNKWPTLDSNRDNDGVEGFVKPTKAQYRALFYRTENGKIVPRHDTALGLYIWKELNLWLPIHSLMWRVERIINLEEKVAAALTTNYSDELQKVHYEILKETNDIFKKIFSDR